MKKILKMFLAIFMLTGTAAAADTDPVTALVLRVSGDAWVEGGEGEFVPLKAGAPGKAPCTCPWPTKAPYRWGTGPRW